MRTVRVKDRLLQHIMSGEKTLEVRVAYDNIKTIRPGERVKMASGTSEILVDIVAVRNYTDFEQMLKFEDPGKIVPGKNDPQVLWLLREIYPEDRESLGVVVLELKVT